MELRQTRRDQSPATYYRARGKRDVASSTYKTTRPPTNWRWTMAVSVGVHEDRHQCHTPCSVLCSAFNNRAHRIRYFYDTMQRVTIRLRWRTERLRSITEFTWPGLNKLKSHMYYMYNALWDLQNHPLVPCLHRKFRSPVHKTAAHMHAMVNSLTSPSSHAHAAHDTTTTTGPSHRNRNAVNVDVSCYVWLARYVNISIHVHGYI